MFSMDIVSSDAFLDMPTSSRELYFQLAMYADDDGFVNPKKIVRMVGASEDDVKVLLAKRFILSFESGVVVIKHWLIHNLLRADRYKATTYTEEKKLLKVKENKAYTELSPLWQPNGNQMATQVRIGKDRKVEIATASVAPFIFKDYLKEMEENKSRHINVIGHYFEEKGITFDTRLKANTAIKRHFRAAKEVSNFSDQEIVKATDKARKEYPGIYTVETILKILTR